MMAKNKLTKKHKVHLVANMPEVTNVMKILTALMKEAKIENFVQYDYIIENEKYRFKFEKLTPKQKK